MTEVKLKQTYDLDEGIILGIDHEHDPHDSALHQVATRLPTKEGKFRIHLFEDRIGNEHIALVAGDVKEKENVLTRVHSECLTGDLFGSLRCDCGPQLHHAMRMISEEGTGLLIYLRQEGRGIGLAEKLKTYNLQDAGLDTVDANLYLGHKAEERDYHIAADILNDLGTTSIRLVSNNPDKEKKLKELGIDVSSRITLEPDVGIENLKYLKTKIDRMGHELDDLQLFPHQPEMDDVRRYIARQRNEKRGTPYISIFNISGLDGQLTYEPRMPGKGPALYRVLRKKIMKEHDSILITFDDLDLGEQVKDLDKKVIIFDPDLKMRLDHPLLGEEGPETVIVHKPIQNGTLEEIKERRIPEYSILDNDGDLDMGAFLEVLKREGISSVMVDGKNGISDMLMKNSLVDTVLNSLVPIISGGRGIKKYSTAFELKDVGNAKLGEEVVYFGRPVVERR